MQLIVSAFMTFYINFDFTDMQMHTPLGTVMRIMRRLPLHWMPIKMYSYIGTVGCSQKTLPQIYI